MTGAILLNIYDLNIRNLNKMKNNLWALPFTSEELHNFRIQGHIIFSSQ